MWEGQREREGTCIGHINLELMCVLSSSSASGTGQSILQIASRLILQQCYCHLILDLRKWAAVAIHSLTRPPATAAKIDLSRLIVLP